jgi:ArsR family transcriptional regulator
MTDPKAAKKAADAIQAIADPTRLRIVELLIPGEKNVTEIATELGVEIVNASHHLGVMRAAGLVVNEKRGRFVAYTLNPEIVTTAGKVTKIECGWCRLLLSRGKA